MNPVASSDSAVSSSAETMVIHFFVELTIILLVSRIVSWAAQRYLGQTKSVGEILAGIALGPSVFGFIFPDVFNSFFNRDVAIVFTAISQLGLLLLMFHMGLEFDISSEFERSKKTIITVSILGITLPFILGVATAGWFWRRIDGSQPDLISFSLFLGVAMSITAIPILGRIFMELGLEKTRIAAITIGAAAIDDMIGWIMLGIVSTLASSSFAISPFLGKVFFLGGYIFLIIAIIGPYLRNRIDAHIRSNEGLNAQLLSSLVISLMISALVTSMLGVFAISGGIILGVSLQKSTHLLGEWKKKVAPFVYSVLLPVFFTNTGLRTDIGSFQSASDVWDVFLLCLIAFLGKFIGGYVAARLTGEDHRSAIVIGVCMNTRALMELVVINVAYDMGVLPRQTFTMLVFMALITTFITTPLLKRLLINKSNSLND